MVKDSLCKGKELGFKIMMFNAVVENNIHAHRLYKHLGFTRLGMIPGGFLAKDGNYENIYLYYRKL